MSKDIKKEIERLEKEIQKLKDGCAGTQERKFKIGDWVCFNHGEYPKHFSKEVGQITHLDYTYDSKGIFAFNYTRGGGWSDDCLRHAHPKEIEYAKSGLPFIFNKAKGDDDRVEIYGSDFKIGNLIDTTKINNMSGKEIITFLMSTNFLNDDGKKYLSIIFEKLN